LPGGTTAGARPTAAPTGGRERSEGSNHLPTPTSLAACVSCNRGSGRKAQRDRDRDRGGAATGARGTSRPDGGPCRLARGSG
jgi:hypothetical protein